MKKILAILMGASSAAVAIFGCAGKKKADRWFLATGEDSGFPLIMRARSEVPSGVDTKIFSSLITVIWKYSPVENGMPGENENQEMDALEDAAESRIEMQKHGYLTAVFTCNGRREWQWYAKDKQQFLYLLNEYLNGKPKYPIEITEQADPNWEEWKGMVSRAKVIK